MKENMTEVICGTGHGKTSLAVGKSLQASMQGKSVIVIQFLKGSEPTGADHLEELDQLDIKIFRFERQETYYNDLSEEEKKEEKNNILNGVNFARKVIATRECDFLVLDELLGLIDMGIVSQEMVEDLLSQKDDSIHIIITGNQMPQWLKRYVDTVTTITTILM